MRKIFAVLLTFQLLFAANPPACATAGNAYDYVLINGTSGGGVSQWALIPYGTIIVGSMLFAAVADRPRGNSDKWNVISEFEPQKTANNKADILVFDNTDMKSRHLHLYQVKIPDELAQSKQKLAVNTTLIYNNAQGGELDFRVLKKTDFNKAAAKINGKDSGKVAVQEQNNDVYVMQKDLKINPSQKEFTLAVYMPISKKNETSSPVKYVALIKIRPIVNKL